jgi:hypothetical protein
MTLVYLCIDENIFHVLLLFFLINECIYIYFKMYLLIIYLLYN